MFMKLFVPVLLVASSAVTPVFSLPASFSNVFARDNQDDKNSTLGDGNNSTTVQKVMHLNDTATRFPDLEYLAEGNENFRSAVKNSSDPNLLKDLSTDGQHPEYLFLGCSDSRVSEGTIFSAPPGALLAQRNIANQFQPIDNNAISVLSYGVQSLGVGHIIVMGHYGCGGVRAAMLPRPNTTGDFSRSSVQSWINPIRHTFLNSTRPEIISYREANENKTKIDPPALDDPAFRALVEENVKDSVFNIIVSPVMEQHWMAYIAQEQAQNSTTSSTRRRANSGATLKPVYVHGFVYDIETGDVIDLGISFGPNGSTSQAPPQDTVKRAVDQHARGHAHL
jgi:carbonic anhydrase